jgi:hypothetical protein
MPSLPVYQQSSLQMDMGRSLLDHERAQKLIGQVAVKADEYAKGGGIGRNIASHDMYFKPGSQGVCHAKGGC